MADERERVIEYIKINGPVLPVNISKHINTNILFSSAILSELVERKILKITTASIGGSPVYYLPGQEVQMDEKLSKSLGGREKEAYQLLKEKKVLREKLLEPWQRIALRNIKDYSKPIQVTISGQEEIFWKYHLVTEEELKKQVNEILNAVVMIQEPTQKQQETITEELGAEIKQTTSQLKQKQTEIKKETPIPELAIKLETKPKLVTKPKKQNQETLQNLQLTQEKTEEKFYEKTKNYLEQNGIIILKEEQLKKDKEIDYLVDINTSLGKLRYLVKAKSKPSITEADITKAHSESQIKNLPVIILTNGNINKKTQKLTEEKLAGQVTIKKL